MSSVFQETNRLLSRYSESDKGILVAYSGGKDSLVLLDLCRRAFRRLAAIHFRFVPDLPWSTEQIAIAESMGIEVIDLIDPLFWEYKSMGLYCDAIAELALPVSASIFDAAISVRDRLGMDLLATGRKRADGMEARMDMRPSQLAQQLRSGIIHPLSGWRKADIMAYLASRKLPIPPSDGRQSSSFDLTMPCITWLHDERPADYEAVRRHFPHVEAAVRRRELYGDRAA